GSVQPVRTDVRILCATNRDLGAAVAAGRFRADLRYRLNVAEIALPPLRERRGGIPLPTPAFVREVSERVHKKIAGIDLAAERLLVAAAWPGNIRQLRNAVERACMLAEGQVITVADIQTSLQTSAPPSAAMAPRGDTTGHLSEVEREHILKIL